MTQAIGQNIKKLREEQGVTQDALAVKLGLTYQAVSKWENGTSLPDIALLPEIAEFFAVTIDELFQVNMSGYRNKAERLTSRYEDTGQKEDFDKALREFETLMSSPARDGEDVLCFAELYSINIYKSAAAAEALYKQAVELGVPDAESQLDRFYANSGRIDEVLELRQNTLNREECNSWLLLIRAYGHAKRYEDALATAREAIEGFPDSPVLLDEAGDICRSLKRYDEAFGYWNKVLAIKPEWLPSHYSLAFAYDDLGQNDKALETWECIAFLLEKNGNTESLGWPRREIARLRELTGTAAECRQCAL